MIKKGLLCLIPTLFTLASVYTQTGRITGGPIPETSYDNLLQGRVYFPVYPAINGSQYLMKDWSVGKVLLQGRWYTNLPLIYDIYADDVIYLAKKESSFDLIRLVKSYIQEFKLGNRKFINLAYSPHRTTGLEPGFYEVQIEDTVTYLIKRKNEVITEKAISSFSRKNMRYLIYDGKAYRVRNKKSLLPLIGEQRKKAVFRFLRTENIHLKKSGDEGWRKVALYLNTLQLD
ncbi:MAG: hypothetical protein KTR30_06525 [Saprospiraceae bacterium]|nr:hypothetical protein [Saprospiraceae bacterium]